MRWESNVKDDHTLHAIFKSFKHAVTGLLTALKFGRNIKVHCGVSLCVIAGGFYFDVSILEWLVLLIVMSQVMVVELLNSAIEFVVDLVTPEYHLFAKYAKDIAAGAVLLSASVAVVIGIIVFLPYILSIK